MDINFLFYSTLLLILPLGQLTRINIFRPEINFYLHEIIAVVLIIFNWELVWKQLKKLRFFWGFVGLGILSNLLNIGNLEWVEIGVSLLYLLRFVVYVFLFLAIREIKNKRIKKLWMWSIVLMLILGFLQYFIVPNQEFLFSIGWDRHNWRLTGTYLDPGFTGIILSMIFFMTIRLMGEDNEAVNFVRMTKKKKFGFLSLLGLIIVSVLLTYSRASYLAFLIALGYFGFKKNKFKLGFLFGLIFVLSLFILPKKFGEGTKLLRTSTIEARLGNYQESLDLIMQRPILGWGFNTLRYVKRDFGISDEKWQVSHSVSGMDNSLLYILATTGVMGLFFYIMMWRGILSQKIDLIDQCILIVIIVGGMFSNVWFYPFVLVYWLMWMGRRN